MPRYLANILFHGRSEVYKESLSVTCFWMKTTQIRPFCLVKMSFNTQSHKRSHSEVVGLCALVVANEICSIKYRLVWLIYAKQTGADPGGRGYRGMCPLP